MKVLSTNGVRLVLERQGVAAVFGTTADLKARMEGGEAFDVAVLTAAAIDELAEKRIVLAETRVEVARSGAGVAVRAGARRPDVSSAEAFRRTLLAAKSVAYVGTSVTAGYLRDIFKRLGIVREMKAKSTVLSGMLAAEAVAKGDAELALTQISEIVDVAGVELAGPFPPELQVYTVFTAAVSPSAREPQAARELVARLASL